MQGYLIKVDGTITDAPEKLDLQGMYETIGCTMVERVSLKQAELWCDEEGIINNKPINVVATRLYQAEHGPRVGIVGDAYLRVKSGYTFMPAMQLGGAIVKLAKAKATA